MDVTNPGSSGGSSKAEATWHECLGLERKLKSVLRKRSFWDAEPRQLRAELRAKYEALLFADLAFASANDVEQLLWKGVFYRPLEEFRSRAREADKAGAAGAAQMSQLTGVALKFLEEAGAWYRRLVMGLQGAYGDVRVKLELTPEAKAAAAALARSAQGSPQRDVRPCIHRCLIYLGDLGRYAAQLSQQADANAARHPPPPAAAGDSPAQPPRPDWGRAAHYYKLAARVLPGSGHPHNQLAVMAFYTGDELRAVTYYYRALSVKLPFLTARENLHLLFEQNRTRYSQLPARGASNSSTPLAALAAEMAVRFVRLTGLLFDRINVEEFDQVSAAAFTTLQAYLQHPQSGAHMMRQPKADAVPLQLLLLAIVGLSNQRHSSTGGGSGGGSQRHHAHGAASGRHGLHSPVAGGGGSGGGGGEAGAQRMLLHAHALQVLLKYSVLLLSAAASRCSRGAPEAAHLLVAAHVLLQWLSAHPHYLVARDAHPHYPQEQADRQQLVAHIQQLVAVVAPLAPEQQQQQQQQGQVQGRGSDGGGLESGEGSLPEEVELLGFQPLVDHQHWQTRQVGKLAADEAATRAARILAAASRIAAAVPELAAAWPTAVEHSQPAAEGLKQRQSSSVVPQQEPQQQRLAAAVAAPTAATAAAAAAAGVLPPRLPPMSTMEVDGEEGEEEEVIVFQPRGRSIGKGSSPGSALAAAAGEASGVGAWRTGDTSGVVPSSSSSPQVPPPGTSAAGPPPVPQQLISSLVRQAAAAASSAPSSPAPAAGRTLPAARHSSVISQPDTTSHRAAAPAAAVPPSAGVLLLGAAATALDLQQAQQASDALLARLAPRGPPASDPLFAAGGLPGPGLPAAADWGHQPTADGSGGVDLWRLAGINQQLGGVGALQAGHATHVVPSSEQDMEGVEEEGWAGWQAFAGQTSAPQPRAGAEGGWPARLKGFGAPVWGQEGDDAGAASWAAGAAAAGAWPGSTGLAAPTSAGPAGDLWGAVLPLNHHQQQEQQPAGFGQVSSAAVSIPVGRAPATRGPSEAGLGMLPAAEASWEGEVALLHQQQLSSSYRLEQTATAAAASILSPYKPGGGAEDAAAAAQVPELTLQQVVQAAAGEASVAASGAVRSLWGASDPQFVDAPPAAGEGGGGDPGTTDAAGKGAGSRAGRGDMWGVAAPWEAPSPAAPPWQGGLGLLSTGGGLLQQVAGGGGGSGGGSLRLPLSALHSRSTSGVGSAHTTPRAVTPGGAGGGGVLGGGPGTPGWGAGLGPPGSARTSYSGDVPMQPASRPAASAAAGGFGMFSGPQLGWDVLPRGPSATSLHRSSLGGMPGELPPAPISTAAAAQQGQPILWWGPPASELAPGPTTSLPAGTGPPGSPWGPAGGGSRMGPPLAGVNGGLGVGHLGPEVAAMAPPTFPGSDPAMLLPPTDLSGPQNPFRST